MNLISDGYALFITFLAFINWAVSIFTFRRVSVRYIDQKLKEEEDDSADWDRGVGGRISLYALAIVSKKVQKVSLVNGGSIKKHARKKIDIRLAWYHFISSIIMFALMFIMYFFFDIDVPESY